MSRSARLLLATVLLAAPSLAVFSVPPRTPPYNPTVAAASDEGLKALKRIRVPAGLKVDLWAAEPLLANPVSFCFDEKGRVYVAETFRLHAGVTDNRNHMNWLDDDLACRTVADRVAMYRKHLGKRFDTYAREHDRVRLLEDTAGKGRADRSTVFADGFNGHDAGIGSGVLARGGSVWYACIPDLWLLRDTKGTGKADVKKSLQHGYGVHVSFLGHDLHGLRFGPDGKLYFSVGDRGLHVEAGGRTVSCPDTGAVLRCNPDGSELEIVATGLRNPQELAFDQYGNLFTGDNNADSGDAARWVYVVEGGDSGWRIGFQYMRAPAPLGPWNAEKLWHLPFEGQAAYLVPPLAHIASGPAGLTYNPGVTLLSERYRDHFFLCDFRGGSGGSGIHAFAIRPRGAAFELVQREQFVWSILATDCEFGPDGGFYLSDWVEGWNLPKKGRIYKVFDPAKLQDPAVAAVRALIANGMAKRPAAELAKLLEHADMRVRQEAQFALAEAKDGEAALARVAAGCPNRLARLHALWGLGQRARQSPEPARQVARFLGDKDAEVRAQAAKVVGEARLVSAADNLVGLLEDGEARVRFFAALSLSKLGRREAVAPVVKMLRDNADRDAYLRHAGVMALARLGDAEALREAGRDAAPAVRLAAVLALRRQGSPDVARPLDDADPRVVAEAARAINDVPIDAALPKLAALSRRRGLTEPVLYRVLNANFRLGGKGHAEALAEFAARADAPAALRVEGLRMLGDWARPSGRDRVMGLWRPLAPRPAGEAAAALRGALGGIFSGPDKVRAEAAKLAAKFGIKEVGPVLLAMVADAKQPAAVRVETLRALEVLKDTRLPEAVERALQDDEPRLRAEGRRAAARLEPDKALGLLEPALERGATVERQGALAVLGGLKQPGVDELLERELDRLLAGKAPPEIHLDLLEAAKRRGAAGVRTRLARYEASRPKDKAGQYREALAGGDAEAGRRVFFYKAEVSCIRCHKVGGEGGDVGPDMAGIGAKQKRAYLLEAIVDPNRQIAKGYETVVLTLADGRIQAGILKSEDAKVVRLMTAEGTLLTVPKEEIDRRTRGPSAMPEDLVGHLTRAEVRDLVEFLAGLK